MTKLQAISKDHYTDKKWQLNPGYSFTEKDSVCPIVLQELPNAMANMPVAFIRSEDKYALVVVQGLTPQTNLFVDANGVWSGKYIPAGYRTYPFLLASTSGDGENLVLCIDEDSGLVGGDEADQAFFDKEGELSERMQEVMTFLSEGHRGRLAAGRVCQQLQELNLLKPWTLQIEYEEGSHKVDGLFCIDEPAFNELSDEIFVELRQSGALPVIYSQLLSMQQMNKLADATQARTNLAADPQPSE